MNKWRPWLIDISLLAITFLLLLFLIIPWGGKSLTQQTIKNNDPNGKVTIDMPEPQAVLQSARERIAGLFGWARPVYTSSTNTAVEKAPTPVANWIIPLSGYVVDENGKFLYLFKNSLNNQILKLPIGGVDKGWKLAGIQANGFLFEYEGKKYIVNKD